MRPGTIHTRSLRKSYQGMRAVCGISLNVEAGEMFGFLGPNGAGKSTTISMLCTLLRPSGGRALVAGIDVRDDPKEVRRRIGLVFQEPTVDTDLTVREYLAFHATLYGLGKHDARRRVAEAADLVGLTGLGGSLVRTLSDSMRRLLEIARGLLHEPGVLFLDEPTVGLNPQARAEIWEHLRELRHRRAITVFLTTHYLEEAEYCDHIAMVDRGRVVADDSPAALKRLIGTDRIHLRTGDDQAAAATLSDYLGLASAWGPDGLYVQVTDAATAIPWVCTVLRVPVHSIEVRRPSLDEVFLRYTGRTLDGVARSGVSP
jgi:ABC-2 type transport system ATP-binding protein